MFAVVAQWQSLNKVFDKSVKITETEALTFKKWDKDEP